MVSTDAGESISSDASLFNEEKGTRFYTPRVMRTIIVQRAHRLSVAEWTDIQSALQAGARPPVPSLFFTSAQQRIEAGDFRTADFELCISVETCIKRAFESILGAVPPGVAELVNRSNISSIFDNWTDLGLPSFDTKPLRELVQQRNRLAHKGEEALFTEELCKKWVSSVRELLKLIP